MTKTHQFRCLIVLQETKSRVSSWYMSYYETQNSRESKHVETIWPLGTPENHTLSTWTLYSKPVNYRYKIYPITDEGIQPP